MEEKPELISQMIQHPIGSKIEELCGGLERFGSIGYGHSLGYDSYFTPPDKTSRDYPGDYANESGTVHLYVTQNHRQLFLQDIGTRENITYWEVGRVGSYDDHRTMKEERLSEAYRSWPGHGFGAGVSHVLDLERNVNYDDRPRIWRHSIQKEEYNHFFEVVVLPLCIWYRQGAERESPAIDVILKPEYHRNGEYFRDHFRAALKRFRSLPKSKSLDTIKRKKLKELLGK